MPKSKIYKNLPSLQSLQPSWHQRIWPWIVAHKVQILVFFGTLVVLFFRRPDAILNAQFWAEDAEWFQRAVLNNFSPATLIDPYAGYLTFFQRFVAMLSFVVPLELSPLFFNLAALFVQALLPVYLWSKRVDFIPTRLKIFITVIYVLLPYSQEVHANLTNSQWYLALLLFVLIFIKESQHWSVRLIDGFFALAASLSGPFSILLVPVVALEAWRTKKMKRVYYIVLFGAVVQVAVILLTRRSEHSDIGYSVTTFLQIVGGQAFASGLFGMWSLGFFFSKPWIAPIIAVLGAQLLTLVFVKSNYVMRYFIYFSSIIFLTALTTNLGTPPGSTWWYFFTTVGFGGRYYLLFHLAVFISLGWVLLSKRFWLWLRFVAFGVLALAFAIGVPNDFVHQPYKDFHYQDYMKQFRQLPPGTKFEIPVNPGGQAWKAVIVTPK